MRFPFSYKYLKLTALVPLLTFCNSPQIKAQDVSPVVSNEINLAFDGWGVAEQLIVPGKYAYIAKLGWLHGTNFQLSIEGGSMNFDRKTFDSIKSFDYHLSGFWGRLGYEQNIFRRNRFDERNFIFIGFHMAYATTKHQGTNIIILDRYWGDRFYSFSPTTQQYLWFDVSVGIRTQLSRHFALGWEIKINRLLYSTGSSSSIEPYYIAGYGKSQNKFTLGINYYLYYTLGW